MTIAQMAWTVMDYGFAVVALAIAVTALLCVLGRRQ